jgi:hypothetical protein
MPTLRHKNWRTSNDAKDTAAPCSPVRDLAPFYHPFRLRLYRALGDSDGIYATVRTSEAVTPTKFEQFTREKLLPNIC